MCPVFRYHNAILARTRFALCCVTDAFQERVTCDKSLFDFGSWRRGSNALQRLSCMRSDTNSYTDDKKQTVALVVIQQAAIDQQIFILKHVEDDLDIAACCFFIVFYS